MRTIPDAGIAALLGFAGIATIARYVDLAAVPPEFSWIAIACAVILVAPWVATRIAKAWYERERRYAVRLMTRAAAPPRSVDDWISRHLGWLDHYDARVENRIVADFARMELANQVVAKVEGGLAEPLLQALCGPSASVRERLARIASAVDGGDEKDDLQRLADEWRLGNDPRLSEFARWHVLDAPMVVEAYARARERTDVCASDLAFVAWIDGRLWAAFLNVGRGEWYADGAGLTDHVTHVMALSPRRRDESGVVHVDRAANGMARRAVERHGEIERRRSVEALA